MGKTKEFQDNCTWKRPIPGSDRRVVLTQVRSAALPGNAKPPLGKALDAASSGEAGTLTRGSALLKLNQLIKY